MKAILVHAMIDSFHRRSLLAFPAAVLVLAALAAWLLVAGSGSAQFVPLIDHFKCYHVDQGDPHFDPVTLTDQFGTTNNTLSGRALEFCNPVRKTYQGVTPITNPDSKLTVYEIDGPPEPMRFVGVDNQFGPQQLTLTDARVLLVPTQKQPFGPPHDLDHFKCYAAIGPGVARRVDLLDQFDNEPNVLVMNPFVFCAPATKVHNAQTYPAMNLVDHLLCYYISGDIFLTPS